MCHVTLVHLYVLLIENDLSVAAEDEKYLHPYYNTYKIINLFECLLKSPKNEAKYEPLSYHIYSDPYSVFVRCKITNYIIKTATCYTNLLFKSYHFISLSI